MNPPEPGAAARPTRIFLSYARGDDETFVKHLHADLTAVGFTVWFDRESLMSRGLNFHQEIKDAIRTEVDRVVYVGGPQAALSAYVREEWQFALECDHVVVTPILRLGDYETCVPGELSLLIARTFATTHGTLSIVRLEVTGHEWAQGVERLPVASPIGEVNAYPADEL
ncbi:MAG: toll/interleukin-1 receptor domain-containing protein [Verrucomicrobia bacterium]|nr:toll/interleukin-1 receptor domain-containing protein [Verrucomicrobiota bacterium]